MKKLYLLSSLIITSTFVDSQQIGNADCDSLILVSSWSRDNVKIYDGCEGTYIRDLAESGVLDGPQAIFQDPNGDVIVVSESNHKLVKFDRETLSNPLTVIPEGRIQNPITAVKKDQNNIYLGSYSSNEIIEIEMQTWSTTRTILPANNSQIQGIDIGMTIDIDGFLYVPGYDSDSILKVNSSNGSTSQFASTGNNQLDRPRSVLIDEDRILVTAWGNQAIFSYSPSGQFLGTVVTGLPGAAGMIQDGPNHILVTSDTISTVRRYNLNDFSFETVVSARSGGLAGATYVYRLQKQTSTFTIPEVRQAWLIGVGNIANNTIVVDELTMNSGGAFGDNFSPLAANTYIWGELLIKFTACHFADMSYSSQLKYNEIPFGTGGYSIQRIAINPASSQCDEVGFENVNDNLWMSGSFYGGPSRDGEGFTVDLLDNERAVVTWFTYLPAESADLLN